LASKILSNWPDYFPKFLLLFGHFFSSTFASSFVRWHVPIQSVARVPQPILKCLSALIFICVCAYCPRSADGFKFSRWDGNKPSVIVVPSSLGHNIRLLPSIKHSVGFDFPQHQRGHEFAVAFFKF